MIVEDDMERLCAAGFMVMAAGFCISEDGHITMAGYIVAAAGMVMMLIAVKKGGQNGK